MGSQLIGSTTYESKLSNGYQAVIRLLVMVILISLFVASTNAAGWTIIYFPINSGFLYQEFPCWQ